MQSSAFLTESFLNLPKLVKRVLISCYQFYNTRFLCNIDAKLLFMTFFISIMYMVGCCGASYLVIHLSSLVINNLACYSITMYCISFKRLLPLRNMSFWYICILKHIRIFQLFYDFEPLLYKTYLYLVIHMMPFECHPEFLNRI